MVIELSNESFDTEVMHADGLVLVDLYATWCGPCQMLAPHVDLLAENYPSLKVCRLDVDRAMEIARRYEIASIPTLLFFRNGELAERHVGYLTYDGLAEIAEGLL